MKIPAKLRRMLAQRDRELPADYMTAGKKRQDVALLRTLATFGPREQTPLSRISIVIARLAQDELCRLGIKPCGRCNGDEFKAARKNSKPRDAKPSTHPPRSRRR